MRLSKFGLDRNVLQEGAFRAWASFEVDPLFALEKNRGKVNSIGPARDCSMEHVAIYDFKSQLTASCASFVGHVDRSFSCIHPSVLPSPLESFPPHVPWSQLYDTPADHLPKALVG